VRLANRLDRNATRAGDILRPDLVIPIIHTTCGRRVAQRADNQLGRKAGAAELPAEAQFWLRMEQRWLRLARTYHETDQLMTAWLP